MRAALAKGLILYGVVPYVKLTFGLILLAVAPFYLACAAIERSWRGIIYGAHKIKPIYSSAPAGQ